MPATLQAVVSLNSTQFTGGLGAMKKAASDFAGALSMAFGGAAAEMFAMAKAFGPIGAGIASLKGAVSVGSDFEQQMANVASVSGLAGEELAKLGTAARDVAKETRFTAGEAGEALYALASAGIAGGEALADTLQPSLLLAGATMSDTKLATETMTAALANFGLEAKDATMVADTFAGAVATSPANMQRLADAMKFAGPAAAAFGMSLQDTVRDLGALHAAGIRGQQAGTSLRQALIKMSEAARSGAGEVGDALAKWDASTEGLAGAVKRLEAAGVDADTVIAELGARAGTGMAAMMNLGSEAIADLNRRMLEAADVAKMYETQMATLQGKTAILKSALEELGQKLFVAISPAFQAGTEALTDFVNWIGELMRLLLGGQFRGALDFVVDSFKNIWETLRGVDWQGAWGALVDSAVAAFEKLKTLAAGGMKKRLDEMFFEGADIQHAWGELVRGLETAWEEIGAFIGEGLAALAEVFLGFDWAGIWETFTVALDAILEAAEANFRGLVAAAGRIIKAVPWARIWGAVVKGLRAAADKMADVLNGLLGKLVNMMTAVDWGGTWRNIFKKIGEAVRAGFVAIMGFFGVFLGDANAELDKQPNKWRAVFEKIKAVVVQIIKALAEALDGFMAGLVGETRWAAFKNKVVGTFRAIRDFVVGVWNKIRNAWESLMYTLENSELWQSFTDTMGKVWDGVKEVGAAAWEGIKKAAKATWDFLSNPEMWASVGKAAAVAWDGIKKGVRAAFDIVKKIVGKVVDFVKGALGKIAKLFKKIFGDGGDAANAAQAGLDSANGAAVSVGAIDPATLSGLAQEATLARILYAIESMRGVVWV